WVAAIRHDAVSGFKTWMHRGSSEVLHFVQAHQKDWQWWDNNEIARPEVSIVAVTPEDFFEAARPDKGVTIRVRCRWANTTHGQPKEPQVELKKLIVDGKEVSPVLVAPKKQSAFTDYYHQFHLQTPVRGKHVATAVVKTLATNVESKRTVQFMVSG